MNAPVPTANPEASQPEAADRQQEPAAMEELSPRQIAALTSLLLASPVAEAAESAGVDRRTIYRWLKGDRAFRAAYREGRRDFRLTAACAMERMAQNAIATVEDAIVADNVNAALQVLKGIGALRPAARRRSRAAQRRDGHTSAAMAGLPVAGETLPQPQE